MEVDVLCPIIIPDISPHDQNDDVHYQLCIKDPKSNPTFRKKSEHTNKNLQNMQNHNGSIMIRVLRWSFGTINVKSRLSKRLLSSFAETLLRLQWKCDKSLFCFMTSPYLFFWDPFFSVLFYPKKSLVKNQNLTEPDNVFLNFKDERASESVNSNFKIRIKMMNFRFWFSKSFMSLLLGLNDTSQI